MLKMQRIFKCVTTRYNGILAHRLNSFFSTNLARISYPSYISHPRYRSTLASCHLLTAAIVHTCFSHVYRKSSLILREVAYLPRSLSNANDSNLLPSWEMPCLTVVESIVQSKRNKDTIYKDTYYTCIMRIGFKIHLFKLPFEDFDLFDILPSAW